jgi:hypothetical protein
MRQVLNVKMVRSNYLHRAFWQRLHECPVSLLNKVEAKNSTAIAVVYLAARCQEAGVASPTCLAQEIAATLPRCGYLEQTSR